MTPVVIRRREPADLPYLAQILVDVHARDGYPVEGVADPEGWLAPPREIAAWTALYDDQPIGQIGLTHASETDDAAILWHRHTRQDIAQLAIPVRLFIDPSHRQRGAGKMLTDTAFSYAISQGLAIAFDVMLKDHVAIRLYESLGSQRLGTVHHHHSGGQIEPAAVYLYQTDPHLRS
jgi:GNAT superfamily N-acetyltransferase